jgi:hypothetical protein
VQGSAKHMDFDRWVNDNNPDEQLQRNLTA